MLIKFILSFYSAYIYQKRMSHTFHKHIRYTYIPIKRNMHIKTKICKNLDSACKYNFLWSALKTLWNVYFCLYSKLRGLHSFVCLSLCNTFKFVFFVPVILTYPKAFPIFPCVNFPESQFVSYGKLIWWIYSHPSIRENMVILHLPMNLIYQTQLWIGFSGFLKSNLSVSAWSLVITGQI